MTTNDELVKRVRHLVNEADDDSSVSLLVVDRCSFDDNIVKLLPQAVAFVQRNKFPKCRRVNVKSVAPVVTIDSGGDVGYVELPSDYVSLVLLSIDGWKQPSFETLSSESPMAMLQNSSCTRAGNCRPVCVDGFADDGKRVLWLYPLPAGVEKVKSFVYEAQYDALAGLHDGDACMTDAVAYECAALLYTLFERYDAANMFHSLALASCNGKVNDVK